MRTGVRGQGNCGERSAERGVLKMLCRVLALVLIFSVICIYPSPSLAIHAEPGGGALRIGHPDAWPGFADEKLDDPLFFVPDESPEDSAPVVETEPDPMQEQDTSGEILPPIEEPVLIQPPALPSTGGREIQVATPPTGIEPIQVMARSRWTDTMGEGAETYPVEGITTLTFWNVGAGVAGHETAVLETVISCAATGESGTIRMEGTFTGGPDGAFHLRGEHGEVAFRLLRGELVETLDPQLGRLRVDKPEAFKYWR